MEEPEDARAARIRGELGTGSSAVPGHDIRVENVDQRSSGRLDAPKQTRSR